MSLEYNFYEELKLSSQDNKITEKDINAAIDKYKNDVTFQYSTTTDATEKSILKKKLDLETGMRIFAGDKNLQKQHKKDLEEKRSKLVKNLVDILKRMDPDPKPTVLQARINTLGAHFDLERGVIKKIFEAGGFTVMPGTKRVINDLFIADSILKDIKDYFNKIQATLKSEQAKPNAIRHVPDGMAKVTNLYEYLAVQRGGSAEQYTNSRSYDANALKSMFDELVKKADRNSNLEPFVSYKNLEAIAMSHIFNTDADREKYNRSLLLIPLCECLLDLVRELPEQLKRDHGFAENIIQEIQKSFPDEDEAIAIYNKFSGLKQDQFYEKEVQEVKIMCECGRLNVHKTIEQARKAMCVNCGKALFRICASCGQPTFSSSGYCSCGYHLADEGEYNKFKGVCADAVKRKDVDAAKKSLDEARRFKPAKADLSNLEREVRELEKEIQGKLAAIEDCINKKKLKEAADKLTILRSQYPAHLLATTEKNLTNAQITVQKMRKQADDEYNRIASLKDLRAKVEAISRLLRAFPDHEPSKALLLGDALRPLSPIKAIAVPNHKDVSVSLSWQPNPDDFSVFYRVVRREGNKPVNPGDGAIVANALKSTNFVDKDAKPGVEYYYAIFAGHCMDDELVEFFSPAAYPPGAVFLTPPLNPETITYEIDGSSCILRWEDVPRSRGVIVERSKNGTGVGKILCECAHNTFVDKNLVMGSHYTYSFSTIWADPRGNEIESPMVLRKEVYMLEAPKPLNARQGGESAEGICEITWDCKPNEDGDVIIFCLNSGRAMEYGKEYDANLLPSFGKKLTITRANAGKATIDIGPNTGVNVVILRSFGNKVIPGKLLPLSSLSPVSIDLTTLSMDNETGNLSFVCHAKNKNISSFLINVIHSNGTMLQYTSKRDGTDNTEIVCTGIHEGEITLEIIGTTTDGFNTPPLTHRVSNLKKAQVNYSLEWKRVFVFCGSVTGLNISGKIDSIPMEGRQLYLCGAPSFHSEDMRYYNPDKMILLKRILPDKNGNFIGHIDNNILEHLPSGGRVCLLADKQDIDIYEIVCNTPKEMKNPS